MKRRRWVSSAEEESGGGALDWPAVGVEGIARGMRSFIW
jgi:hypothetical protein